MNVDRDKASEDVTAAAEGQTAGMQIKPEPGTGPSTPFPESAIAGTQQASPQTGGGSSKAAAAAKPKSKKKGTAAVVKTAKRGGGGGGSKKKAGGGGAKKTAKVAAKPKDEEEGDENAVASRDEDGDDAGEDGSEDDSEDNGPYCLCRGPDDHRWMINCEACEDWFHGECVNITKEVGETLIQLYVCPNCTRDGKDGRVPLCTMYKKTCTLEGCMQPAKVYPKRRGSGGGGSKKKKQQDDDEDGEDAGKKDDGGGGGGDRSVFCSQEHCNVWWEQLVATLPKTLIGGNRKTNNQEDGGLGLTQGEFMGLLVGTSGASKGGASKDKGWFVGQRPFLVPTDFWKKHKPEEVLTQEEMAILKDSEQERKALNAEMDLYKKMFSLLEMATAQRDGALSSESIHRDTCGYDTSLDTVGAPAQFAAFLRSPAGQAIFKEDKEEDARKLESAHWVVNANTTDSSAALMSPTAATNGSSSFSSWHDTYYGGLPADTAATRMCVKRKCKAHATWQMTHLRQVRFQTKALAGQVARQMDAESRVRNGAALRFFRKKTETSSVVTFESEDDDDDDLGRGKGKDGEDEVMSGC